MQVFNHRYKDKSSLKNFISHYLNKQRKSLLVQIFSGVLDLEILQGILNQLSSQLPDAVIIGSSTCGEIIDGIIYDEQILISFSTFETVALKSYYVKEVTLKSGYQLGQDIINEETKAVICFLESLKSDPTNFLEGFGLYTEHVILAGGNAADNSRFVETFVIKDSHIYTSGMVLCTLESKELIVNNDYTLNWTPIGKELIITRSKENIVYEINDIPILELYKYYFGTDIEKELPDSIVEFPLLKHENKVDIARSLVAVNSDNSFTFAGQFKVGDRVRFAIGNVVDAIDNAKKFSNKVSQKPAEGIYVYSCMVRKKFLKDELKSEFSLLNQIAPVSGFFTYGEFYSTDKSIQLLNITTTILILSEVVNSNVQPFSDNKKSNSTIKSLAHFLNVTEYESEEKTNIMIQNSRLSQSSEIVSMLSHQWRQPLATISAKLMQIQLALHKPDIDDKERINQNIKETDKIVSDLSSTLNDFSIYLRHERKLSSINLEELLNKIFKFMSATFDTYEIKVLIEIPEKFILNTYVDDLKQVITNIIRNAQDVLLERKILEPYIRIKAYQKEAKYFIEIEDNAGGIEKGFESKVFDPYYTTKSDLNGVGLGLYMSKIIIERNLKGHLYVLNKELGAQFIIELDMPKKI